MEIQPENIKGYIQLNSDFSVIISMNQLFFKHQPVIEEYYPMAELLSFTI